MYLWRGNSEVGETKYINSGGWKAGEGDYGAKSTAVGEVITIAEVNTLVLWMMNIDVEVDNVGQEGGGYCYTVNDRA